MDVKAQSNTNLLLVGKTGNGKSATGNSIVDKQVFKTGANTRSVTQECQEYTTKVLEKEVKVVDLPGFADTGRTSEETLKIVVSSIEESLAMSVDGYDAILMVIKLGRLTGEDKLVFDQINAIFGQEYISQYGILVVTYGDSYDPEENDGKSFEKWCLEEKGLFKDLLQQCNGRVILFDNKSKDQVVKENQLNHIFRIMEKMRSGKKRYTPELFDKAKAARERAICDTREPLIRDETEGEIRQIMEEMDKLDREDISGKETLKKRVKTLLDIIIEQDKGTGSLNKVKALVDNCLQFIDASIESDKRVNAKDKERIEEMTKLQQKMKKILSEESSRKKQKIIEGLQIAHFVVKCLVGLVGLSSSVAIVSNTVHRFGIVSLVKAITPQK